MSRPVLLAVLLIPALAVGQDYSGADLAVQARAVLDKHCSSCHGDRPGRSPVKVLDHTALTSPAGPDRPIPFFSKKLADASLALDLIREGSMPPGGLAKVPDADIAILQKWVDKGSKKFPVRFDDEFVHTTILEDVEKMGAQQAPDARYLTLHHVAATSPAELGTARDEFLTALKSLIKKNAPFDWVDDTATICRIDIGKTGWDYRPFIKLDDRGKEKKNERVKATIFDLVLLEYPHAVIPRNSDAFNKLVMKFLIPAEQVRPIPFVRGDWFAATAMSPRLKKELETLVQRSWSTVPAGLDHRGNVKAPVVRPGPPPAPNGVPLPALDAWYAADDPPDPKAVREFTVETINPFTHDKKDTFKADDFFRLRLTADPGAHIQYVYVEYAGKVEDRTNVETVPASGKVESPDLPPGGFAAVRKPETEYLRAFAAPHKFGNGEKWRVRDAEIERFVHPFFSIDRQSGKVDLTDLNVTRKTATITIK
jgi:mono/diheme cytochrome c family protein